MHGFIRALAGVALAGVGLSGAAVAQAQGMPSGEGEAEYASIRWEVTPFAGYRMGGSFDLEDITGAEVAGGADLNDHGSFGLAVGLSVYPGETYELFYSRQETSIEATSPLAPFDLDVEYLHLGGTLVLNEELPIVPYMMGGLGVTRFSPQTGTGSDDTRFSMSLGAGLRLPVTQNLGVRLEARGYLTFVNSESAFFCASGSFGGVCSIRAKTDTLFQFELLAGASFWF
jgi:opacity protein-like surface antigen